MNAGIIAACGIGAAVAGINVSTMRRLWASAIFERPQKIAQSILLWVIPGSFLLVRRMLVDHVPGRSLGPGDATVANGDLSEYDGAGGHGHGHGGGDGGGASVGGD